MLMPAVAYACSSLRRLTCTIGSFAFFSSGPAGTAGPAGPAGQDGEDGTVGTTNYYNKAQVDFLLATNTPSFGACPGEGIRAWDDQQDLKRNVVGQNGVSVSLHGDGDVSSLVDLGVG